MIIAEQKRKSNIAEFILYMWQVEDLIRASNFSLKQIDQLVISKFSLPGARINEIRNWYQNLITVMVEENLSGGGHISYLRHLIRDLNDLHLRLLNDENEEVYRKLYRNARPNIESYRSKSTDIYSSDIEACLTGLYGYLMLRLQKTEISPETRSAMTSFSNLLAALSTRFREMESRR